MMIAAKSATTWSGKNLTSKKEHSMHRYVIFCSAWYLLMVVPSASLFAQLKSDDPRTRRANREKAVAMTGPIAREFVETYGDEAVAAIFACSKAVAVKLAEFHASGELGKLPRPLDLLRAIANPRLSDDVANWAILHAGELHDTDSFDAYLASPLEYALGLKQLKAGAAEARAKRLNPTTATAATGQPTTKPTLTLSSLLDDDRIGFACAVGLVVMAVLAIFRKKRSQSY
jgi:hypothetical protein